MTQSFAAAHTSSSAKAMIWPVRRAAVKGAMTFPDVLYSTGSLYTAAVGVAVGVLLAWRGKSLLTVALSASAAVAVAQLVFR